VNGNSTNDNNCSSNYKIKEEEECDKQSVTTFRYNEHEQREEYDNDDTTNFDHKKNIIMMVEHNGR